MIALSIFAEAGPIENLKEIGTQTGFDLQHLISNVIAIFIVCAILQKFAYKPVRDVLNQRRQAIEEGIANAAQIKKELAETEAARLAVLQKANEQANHIIAEAEKSAAIRGEQKTQEATRQAEEIIKKAHEASVLDRDRLMADLKRQIGTLVIQTTEKIAGKVLTTDDQSRLNTETISQINASNN